MPLIYGICILCLIFTSDTFTEGTAVTSWTEETVEPREIPSGYGENMWHIPPGFFFRASYIPVSLRSAHLLPICFPISIYYHSKVHEVYVKSRITGLPVILQYASKHSTESSEFECSKTGILLSFLGHYVDGRLFVATTHNVDLIPIRWPCTQQRGLTGLDEMLAGKSCMNLLYIKNSLQCSLLYYYLCKVDHRTSGTGSTNLHEENIQWYIYVRKGPQHTNKTWHWANQKNWC